MRAAITVSISEEVILWKKGSLSSLSLRSSVSGSEYLPASCLPTGEL